jgi:MFS family permease
MSTGSVPPSPARAGAGGGRATGMGASLVALNAVNFFMADVQSGLGPFLGVYLINRPGWNAATVGLEMTLGPAMGLLLQTPAGALIDATSRKRALLALAALLTSAGTFIVTLTPTAAVVTTAQVLTGLGGVLLAPVIAAIALGLVGPSGYTLRTGRMAAFNHAGNVIGSVVAGLAGYLVSLRTGFWLASLAGILVLIATLFINGRLINHRQARGFIPDDESAERPSGFAVLLRNRPLLMLSVVTMLWQLANGAMLPITGQKLAIGNTGQGALFQAALIIVAQLVMIPMAILVGSRADGWGRKPIYLAAFVVLPIRGLLFALAANTTSIVAIQALDGVGAGIQGALFPIMVADLTRGTGRYNIALGAATVVAGIGVTLSTTVAGAIIVATGYNTAMFSLTGIALLGLVLLMFTVPETSTTTPTPPKDSTPGTHPHDEVSLTPPEPEVGPAVAH